MRAPARLRGIRARLTVTLVTLVALTAALLGVGSYVVVDNRLHDQFLADARSQAVFDLSELASRFGLSTTSTPADINSSGFREAVQRRDVLSIVDDGGDVSPVDPASLRAIRDRIRPTIDRGQLAFAWLTIDASPSLVVGGRLGSTGAPIYYVHDATELETTLEELRLALGGIALLLVLVALLAARAIARGVLAPVEEAGRAAEQIERGDLSARVAVSSGDEFGTWAERFNRMAAALAETIGRLEAAEAQNRRFVADVAHELRTPLAALVAEASILRGDLGSLPTDSRRAGELLVADVARLRVLVDELMELSRFDAAAERISVEPVDLGRLVGTVVAGRLPDASLRLPSEPLIVETDPRRLERILANLLDNAREHGDAAGVEVALEATVEVVVLAVADRGPGVPSDRLGQIFDRFYKADPSRAAGGSGLGLAIAAEHAALLGAELRATNRDGGGLLIELRLPVTGSLRGGDLPAIGGSDRGVTPIAASEPTT